MVRQDIGYFVKNHDLSGTAASLYKLDLIRALLRSNVALRSSLLLHQFISSLFHQTNKTEIFSSIFNEVFNEKEFIHKKALF